MHHETTRPMSERERYVLEQALENAQRANSTTGFLAWAVLWLTGSVALPVAGIAIAGSLGRSFGTPGQVVGVLISVIAILAGIASLLFLVMLVGGHLQWRRVQQRWHDHDAPQIRGALENGRVHVRRFTATAVIEIDQREDEGGGYLFEIGTNAVLVLKGQIYESAEEDAPWPNSAFELVRTAHGNRWVGIFCDGEKLTPRRTILPSQTPDQQIWRDREDVVEGNLEAVANNIASPG
jgi:hypothetical protein